MRAARSLCGLLLALGCAFLGPAAYGETRLRDRIPLLLDTDIGDDIDDALALALALSSPELDLRGITTVQGDSFTRALVVCRLLHEVGRDDIPVAAGSGPRPLPQLRGQFQYGLRPCFRKRPVKEKAIDFLYRNLKAEPGKLTILAIGPLTNVAGLLDRHPDCKPWIKRVVLMGGSVRVGYNSRPPAVAEWNITSDVKAARIVFQSGIPLVVAPLDATADLALGTPMRARIFGGRTALTNQLYALYQLWDKPAPVLFDPVAVALCFEEKFCRLESLRLDVDDKGFTRVVQGKPNARVATSIQREEYLKWYVDRVAPSKPAQAEKKRAPLNVSSPIARGGMPNRVYVFEDYETDIERRWWLCGKLETKNVPRGSTRACRGVLTNDFDDRQGDPKAMYTAVIFNPVPGPPMGKNTRLGFRYWLRGTGELRVQIYSLSKGYHRCLTLTNLPQGRWQAATVDMTAARKPDGGGGPLAEDERIDDIQFYTDAGAELFIDDIVLFDAALPNEKRPFPKRFLFTGWFDTGKLGKEWPGDFEIVAKKKPLTWKAAKSVPSPNKDRAWIRLHLRGDRILGKRTHLSFRYHLTGTSRLNVYFVNGKARRSYVMQRKDLQQGRWAETTLDFLDDSIRAGDRVDEIHFFVPTGSELLIDDVLLFEPGD
jgi:inosine-uridine nucleoside N-ribohydrolase